MKDTETIQTLKTLLCLINNSESHYIEISAETLESTLDLISRYNAEIERLKRYEDIRPTGCPNCHKGNFSNSKFCSHCGTQLQGKKIDAKSEAIKEVVGKTQAFLAIKCRGVVENNPNLDEILWGYRKEDVDEFFDNLLKEMEGNTE